MNDPAAMHLDHFIIGVAELEEASHELSVALGRSPSWRGRHPATGTANVIFRLDNVYIELLAPDPEPAEVDAWAGSLGRFLNDSGGGLFSMALATTSLAGAVPVLRQRGLTVEDPIDGEGRDLYSSAVRRWLTARVPPETTRGTRILLIEHRSSADALPPARILGAEPAAATGVLAVAVESVEVAVARGFWREVIGLDEEPWQDGWRYDLGNASLLLRGGVGQATAPHRWLRLVLSVPSVTALADRLDGVRVSFQQGDFVEASGVLVECGGAELLLTESLS